MQQSKRQNCVFYLFLILLICSSCSLEKRLENKQRRAERKIEKLTIKYPQLLERDTVKDTFNIITSSVKHDTSFIDTTSDTTYIYKDKLRIKYIRVGDTTYIEGKCKSDTIVQTIEIPVERIVVKKQSIIDQIVKYFKRSIIWVIILSVIAIIIRIAWKFIKKSIWPLG